MAKRQRWVLRVAFDIDGGLTTANVALEELEKVRKALEDAGYHILDQKGMAAPMAPVLMEHARAAASEETT